MFDLNALDILVKSLGYRNFEVETHYNALGGGFEAVRSFSNGDYYLFTLNFENSTPLRLEIYQDGYGSTVEFDSLVSLTDVKQIILFCEEKRFPYSWRDENVPVV